VEKRVRLWASDVDGIVTCERHADDEFLIVLRQATKAPAYEVGEVVWRELLDHERAAFTEATGQAISCDECVRQSHLVGAR